MIKIFAMSVDIKPIPASRPRVTQFGTYNAKPYSVAIFAFTLFFYHWKGGAR